jgi:ethanolamine utilization protein EutA (predicted chaperonin)
LLSRPGAGAATLQKGVAHVTIRDVIDIGGGTTVQVLYDRDVMIPHPNG